MRYLSILICGLITFSAFGQDTSNIKESEELIHYVPQNPEFPGGVPAMYKWISKNIAYPNEAMKKAIQGKVFVRFLVEKDGTITNVEVKKGIGFGGDQEAIRIIKAMPKWIPQRKAASQ